VPPQLQRNPLIPVPPRRESLGSEAVESAWHPRNVGEAVPIPTPLQDTESESAWHPSNVEGAVLLSEEPENSERHFLAFVNRGLVRGVTFGLGMDSLIAGMNSLGMPTAQRGPETLGERVEEGVGTAIGVLPGMVGTGLKVAGVLGKGGYAASKYMAPALRTMFQPFISRPVTTATIEGVAGVGSGVGRHVAAERFPESPTGEALGEMAGAMGGGMTAAISGAPRRMAWDATKRIYKAAESGLFPFTKRGARARAEVQLQKRAVDPKATAEAVTKETIGDLSPAQISGEDDLIALEQVLQNRDPASWKRYQDAMKRSEAALREAAIDVVDPDIMTQQVDEVLKRVEGHISSLQKSLTPQEASALYARELEAAFTAVKGQEEALWAIPNVRVEITNLKRVFNELISGATAVTRAQRADMPADARRLLQGPRAQAEDALILGPRGETLVTKEVAPQSAQYGNSETAREIHGFYSKMREVGRNARAGDTPNFNKARLADKLAKAAWLDIEGAADNPTAVGEAFNIAREYSRLLNQTYRRGSVGRLLGYDVTGGQVGPEATLEVVLGGRGGAQAAITVDELTRAATFGKTGPGGRSGAQAQTAMRDYIKRRFLRAAIPSTTKTYSSTGARGFITHNEGLLSRFPELSAELQQSATAMQSADVLEKLRPSIAVVLKAQNPRASMRSLLNTLTPTERLSVKAGLLEQGLYTGQIDPESGAAALSGSKLSSLIRNPKTRGVFEEAFGVEGSNRLLRIADELRKLDRAMAPVSPVIGGEEIPQTAAQEHLANVATYLIGTSGARIGSWFGRGASGASLRTAAKAAAMSESYFWDFMNRHSSKLLLEAVDDHELYKSLMTPLARRGPQEAQAVRRLAAWVRKAAQEVGEAALKDVVEGTRVTGAAMGGLAAARAGEQLTSPAPIPQPLPPNENIAAQ
jgi:hypothetical protein